MVFIIKDIAIFTIKLKADWDPDLLFEISGRWLKVITYSFATKPLIIFKWNLTKMASIFLK